MKKFYITVFASAALLTACEMEQLPEGGVLTEEQKNEVIADNPDKLQGDLNALKDNLIQFGTISTSTSTIHSDYGFPAICLIYDQGGQDMVAESHGYNWFMNALSFTDRIPTSDDNTMIWKLHYQHIRSANSVLTNLYAAYPEESERVGEIAIYLGQSLASRAFDYLQLIQTYQFTYQGHEEALGLPLVTEETTQDQATNNPRATVQAVYEQIMSDLNLAIAYLGDYYSSNGEISAAVAYGLRARANMLMGNYADAASDADQAIALSGATPYSRDEVSVPAFNDGSAKSWIWGSIITSNNDVVTTGIINWPSHLCSLTGNGYTTGTGTNVAYRRLNSTLWERIPNTDVRKSWWVDENLQSEALNNAYGADGPVIGSTLGYLPYTNVKFGPEGGVLLNTENSQDWPLMRAEEMLLIKAEGLARSQGVAAGKTVLESFVQTYRDPNYTCSASSLEDFIDEVWFQRRIELWGEGFSLFDILRLKKPIVRIGTNFSANVTYADIAAESPIMIFNIPECETSANNGIPLNQINEVATPPVAIMQ